jgi:hypothetical protein
VTTGRKVSLKVMQARVEKCYTDCDQTKQDDSGIYCGVCNCSVVDSLTRVLNLAVYVENMPKWGCKHPYRGLPRPQGGYYGWSIEQ